MSWVPLADSAAPITATRCPIGALAQQSTGLANVAVNKILKLKEKLVHPVRFERTTSALRGKWLQRNTNNANYLTTVKLVCVCDLCILLYAINMLYFLTF